MVHLVCLFMKMHLLVTLLQDNCLDLVHCGFLRKSGCVRNITVFCQNLLKLITSAILVATIILVKPKSWPGRYIGLSLIKLCMKSAAENHAGF